MYGYADFAHRLWTDDLWRHRRALPIALATFDEGVVSDNPMLAAPFGYPRPNRIGKVNITRFGGA